MNKFYLVLLFLGISTCHADQKHWNQVQSLLCSDGNGNRPQISEEQLSQLGNKCKIARKENGPISSCAASKVENNRDLLDTLCNAQTFSCVKNKPILSDSDLQSTENPEQLKEQFVGCIENVIKYNHYLFDDRINFN